MKKTKTTVALTIATTIISVLAFVGNAFGQGGRLIRHLVGEAAPYVADYVPSYVYNCPTGNCQTGTCSTGNCQTATYSVGQPRYVQQAAPATPQRAGVAPAAQQAPSPKATKALNTSEAPSTKAPNASKAASKGARNPADHMATTPSPTEGTWRGNPVIFNGGASAEDGGTVPIAEDEERVGNCVIAVKSFTNGDGKGGKYLFLSTGVVVIIGDEGVSKKDLRSSISENWEAIWTEQGTAEDLSLPWNFSARNIRGTETLTIGDDGSFVISKVQPSEPTSETETLELPFDPNGCRVIILSPGEEAKGEPTTVLFSGCATPSKVDSRNNHRSVIRA